jgi:hypothetical protein
MSPQVSDDTPGWLLRQRRRSLESSESASDQAEVVSIYFSPKYSSILAYYLSEY